MASKYCCPQNHPLRNRITSSCMMVSTGRFKLALQRGYIRIQDTSRLYPYSRHKILLLVLSSKCQDTSSPSYHAGRCMQYYSLKPQGSKSLQVQVQYIVKSQEHCRFQQQYACLCRHTIDLVRVAFVSYWGHVPMHSEGPTAPVSDIVVMPKADIVGFKTAPRQRDSL
jgi:hypothetical protein